MSNLADKAAKLLGKPEQTYRLVETRGAKGKHTAALTDRVTDVVVWSAEGETASEALSRLEDVVKGLGSDQKVKTVASESAAPKQRKKKDEGV